MINPFACFRFEPRKRKKKEQGERCKNEKNIALLHLLYLGMDLEILNGKNDVEKRVSEEISKRMSESASLRNKEFRDHYKQKQKEAFDKNPNLTANILFINQKNLIYSLIVPKERK